MKKNLKIEKFHEDIVSDDIDVACNKAEYTNQLVLSNLRLQAVPDLVCQLTDLVELHLNQNSLSSLPLSISLLSNLKVLNASGNPLLTITGSDIGKLSQLETLDLASCDLESLDGSEIGTLKHLRILNVSGNRLKSLPKEVGDLKKLQVLEAHKNQLDQIGDEICDLDHLELIMLQKNHLQSLPSTFGHRFQKLKTLYLQNNNFSGKFRFGSNDTKSNIIFTNLHRLYLGYNSITDLDPDQFTGQTFPKLTVLHIKSNKLSSLPPRLNTIGSLYVLHVGLNHLTFAGVQSFSVLAENKNKSEISQNLKILELQGNPIVDTKKIAETLSGFTQLKRLHLFNCGLTGKIDEESGLWELKNLKVLNLGGNHLDEVSERLEGLGQLKRLYLEGNEKLVGLPKAVGRMKCLEFVSFGKTQENVVGSLEK